MVDSVDQEAPKRRRGSHPAKLAGSVECANQGVLAKLSAETQIDGVIGSCRWRTSNSSRSSVRRMRKCVLGERTMFGSDPFAGTITDRPTGITFGGGLP